MPNALITGTSSGLGKGLASHLLDLGWTVYGCGRRVTEVAGIVQAQIDLTDFEQLPTKLDALTAGLKQIDLVVLNAGVLGEIRDLSDTPIQDVKNVMEINLWANKAVMDWLHQAPASVAQVVMISSGASVLGNRGWGGYALSKAALNMLAKLYAHEFPSTHISALAPGIIETPMMDHLCDEADAQQFPALQRLQGARGTEAMPEPAEAARRIVQTLGQLQRYPSGSFIDIREILEPEIYAALYARNQ